jgi:cytochrome c oxidase assembly protein subunit 15
VGTFAGTIAQAPLGFVTIYFDLHPLLVLSHFLLALVVLAGGTVVALEAWRGRRTAFGAAGTRWLRPAGLALGAAALVLVVSGTLATAAGPHSGGADIRRLGNLLDAVELHVRATAVFGVVFLALLVYLARRRREQPLLFRGALLLLALLLVQMVVGEVQWRTQLPWGVVLVHVALAAAVWAATVALVHAIWRLPAAEPQPYRN